MPEVYKLSDEAIRLQCLEMANRQHFNTSATGIVESAQKLYDFALAASREEPEKQAHGF